MKSILDKLEGEIFPFPKLMETDEGLIVLMLYDGHGTVVHSDVEYSMGQYSVWDLGLFKEYKGSITLRN
jgi:hypothetical protein